MSWKTAFAALGMAWMAILFSPGVANAQMSNEPLIKRGKFLWEYRGCGICHGIGAQNAGPDLAGVGQRRSKEWLHKWLKETSTMIGTDSVAMAMVAEYRGQKMPQYKLSEKDIDALLAYVDKMTK